MLWVDFSILNSVEFCPCIPELTVRGHVVTSKYILSLQECCLCMLRGGALKPTTSGTWAHIICGISVAEATFDDTSKRGPINVSKVPTARMRLVTRKASTLLILISGTSDRKSEKQGFHYGGLMMFFHLRQESSASVPELAFIWFTGWSKLTSFCCASDLAEVCVLSPIAEGCREERCMYPVLYRQMYHLLPCHMCLPCWGGVWNQWLAVSSLHHLPKARRKQIKGE